LQRPHGRSVTHSTDEHTHTPTSLAIRFAAAKLNHARTRFGVGQGDDDDDDDGRVDAPANGVADPSNRGLASWGALEVGRLPCSWPACRCAGKCFVL